MDVTDHPPQESAHGASGDPDRGPDTSWLVTEETPITGGSIVAVVLAAAAFIAFVALAIGAVITAAGGAGQP